jgi:D-glycero-D-manno-heptose 1,7-bisphosphate phosphatase
VVNAIFMDRDGTVSEEIGYMYTADIYRPFPWTGPAIRLINESGMKAVLITNQSGVERGYFQESMVHAVHRVLDGELKKWNAHLDAIYFCPHQPDTGCDCRKPKPGMILRAARELDIDLENSYMIGDRYLDVEVGRVAGAKSILVRTGNGAEELQKHPDYIHQPNYVADNLLSAVAAILTGHVK